VVARRILVYGVTGSGKSTAAARIAAALALPYVASDDLAWQPGWVATDDDTLRSALAALAATDAWVIDANYRAGRDLVQPRIELVVGMDYPRWLSLWRLFRRTVSRIVRRTPVCNGNVETWRKSFLDGDSILVWHFRSFARKRRELAEWSSGPDGPRTLVFRRPRDLEAWISRL
jgi:adenylate kinase family enzyme